METRDQIEKRLTDTKVDFVYVEKLALDQIDWKQSFTNQARISDTINKDTISLYQAAMEGGDIFPPIVVCEKGSSYVTIDGNHRLYSAREVKWDSYPFGAYIVKNISDMQYRILIYEANLTHGLPASIEDRLYHAVYLVETSGMTQTDAAKRMKISSGRLSTKIALNATIQRLAGLGLGKCQGMVPSGLISLNIIPDDDVFKEAVEVAYSSKMEGTESAEFSKAIRNEKSAKKQLEFIGKEKEKTVKIEKATAGADAGMKKTLRKITLAVTVIKSITMEEVRVIPAGTHAEFIKKLNEGMEAIKKLKDAF